MVFFSPTQKVFMTIKWISNSTKIDPCVLLYNGENVITLLIHLIWGFCGNFHVICLFNNIIWLVKNSFSPCTYSPISHHVPSLLASYMYQHRNHLHSLPTYIWSTHLNSYLGHSIWRRYITTNACLVCTYYCDEAN